MPLIGQDILIAWNQLQCILQGHEVLHEFVCANFAILTVLGRVQKAVKDVSELYDPVNPAHDEVHDELVFKEAFEARLGQCHAQVAIHAQANWIRAQLLVGFSRVHAVKVMPERLLFDEFPTTTNSSLWRQYLVAPKYFLWRQSLLVVASPGVLAALGQVSAAHDG